MLLTGLEMICEFKHGITLVERRPVNNMESEITAIPRNWSWMISEVPTIRRDSF
jgi:hypothetical protein